MAKANAWGGRRLPSLMKTTAGDVSSRLLEKTDVALAADEKTLTLLRSQFDRRCVSSLPLLFDTAIELATGAWAEEEVEDSQGRSRRRVYQKLPDRAMLSFLMEHGIGKAAAKSPREVDQTISVVMNHPRPKRKAQSSSPGAGIYKERDDGTEAPGPGGFSPEEPEDDDE